jgi:hypothetical protein
MIKYFLVYHSLKEKVISLKHADQYRYTKVVLISLHLLVIIVLQVI